MAPPPTRADKQQAQKVALAKKLLTEVFHDGVLIVGILTELHNVGLHSVAVHNRRSYFYNAMKVWIKMGVIRTKTRDFDQLFRDLRLDLTQQPWHARIAGDDMPTEPVMPPPFGERSGYEISEIMRDAANLPSGHWVLVNVDNPGDKFEVGYLQINNATYMIQLPEGLTEDGQDIEGRDQLINQARPASRPPILSPVYQRHQTGSTEPSFGQGSPFPTLEHRRTRGVSGGSRPIQSVPANDQAEPQLNQPRSSTQLPLRAASNTPGQRHTFNGSSTTTLQPVTPEQQIIQQAWQSSGRERQLPPPPGLSSERAVHRSSIGQSAPGASDSPRQLGMRVPQALTQAPYHVPSYPSHLPRTPSPTQPTTQLPRTPTPMHTQPSSSDSAAATSNYRTLPLRFWPLEARQAIGLGGLETPMYGPSSYPPTSDDSQGGVSLSRSAYPSGLHPQASGQRVSPASEWELQQMRLARSRAARSGLREAQGGTTGTSEPSRYPWAQQQPVQRPHGTPRDASNVFGGSSNQPQHRAGTPSNNQQRPSPGQPQRQRAHTPVRVQPWNTPAVRGNGVRVFPRQVDNRARGEVDSQGFARGRGAGAGRAGQGHVNRGAGGAGYQTTEARSYANAAAMTPGTGANAEGVAGRGRYSSARAGGYSIAHPSQGIEAATLEYGGNEERGRGQRARQDWLSLEEVEREMRK